MEELTQRHCIACDAGTPAMTAQQAEAMLGQVPAWELADGRLSRCFKFKNFREAMSFINRVAELAESEGHHPDIHISWNRVRLDLITHSIHGLSENDFILAAKLNAF